MKNVCLNKKGFTLVELLAVIVILALLIVITANTVLPMMSKTEKSGMVTYADRVLSNAAASAQADVLVAGTTPAFYYKITELMEQEDYFGCVKVSKSGDDFIYELKMFSNTDKYFVYASASDSSAPATVNNNGTITAKSGKDLLKEMEYTGTKPTATTLEGKCQADVTGTNYWSAIIEPTS